MVVFEGVVRNNNQGQSGPLPGVRLRRRDDDSARWRNSGRIWRIVTRSAGFAMVHRLGQVPVGEASVVVVVAAPHRKPAFAVAMEAMDRLKSDVAIWKKEYFENGAVWPAGDWSEALLHH